MDDDHSVTASETASERDDDVSGVGSHTTRAPEAASEALPLPASAAASTSHQPHTPRRLRVLVLVGVSKEVVLSMRATEAIANPHYALLLRPTQLVGSGKSTCEQTAAVVTNAPCLLTLASLRPSPCPLIVAKALCEYDSVSVQSIDVLAISAEDPAH